LPKERLLDIPEEDIKKEGFKQRWEFLKAFNRILKGKLIEEKPNGEFAYLQNPEVWVLDFKVKKKGGCIQEQAVK